jgi:hypothetical protein
LVKPEVARLAYVGSGVQECPIVAVTCEEEMQECG